MRIQINNVSHDFAGTVILSGVTAAITPGRHIGLVGANGCGKTTLVRIIVGELEPVSGTVTTDAGASVGYVPQAMETNGAGTVGEFLLADILDLRTELSRLEHAMADASGGSAESPQESPRSLDAVLREYEDARERYDGADGDTAEERAERLLSELGLAVALDSSLTTLSGGEQNVLALGRAVISRPDLLILDEPGNHLDFTGLAWLEEYLKRYSGAVLVVSHNRYLLDRVADVIWELDRARLTEYTGNYSDYRFARLTRALSDQATHAVQQRKLARLEELVRTFEERARVTGDPKWGKRLRARRTQLEKAREAAMDAPSLEDDPITVSFARSGARSDIALDIIDYSKAFGERVLLDGAALTVHVGDRMGMVGPNGSGKTTLLEELVSTGDWEHPSLRVGPSMRIGYCAQKRGRFPAGTSVLDAMLRGGNYSRNEVFGVLSRLRFEWDDLERPVETLSGGEWNRLQLAIAIIDRANLLILDEPTNHLDIPSREAVEEALDEFDGTILAVSHDRYFLDSVARSIVELANRQLVRHDGGFTEWWYSGVGTTGGKRSPGGKQSPGGRQSAGGARGKRADSAALGRARAARSGSPSGSARAGKTHGDPAAIEHEIMQLEARRGQLEAEMAGAFSASDYRRGRRLGEDLAKVQKRIDELYARWGV